MGVGLISSQEEQHVEAHLYSQYSYETGAIVIPILQMMTLSTKRLSHLLNATQLGRARAEIQNQTLLLWNRL